jgi:hypothetical protein
MLKKQKSGIFGDRWQPVMVRFDGKDGVGYPMPDRLDSDIAID